ncbi:hypothetical protein CK203_081771 [Vitis vinifera]|uniref:Uncharacterized protein n=1 Tax=Vitis vinifera TaxID=29760 RepID=A0A438EFC3_VITVI|nr:hypothetical protein CK203_081771 [Vitis vinifera]
MAKDKRKVVIQSNNEARHSPRQKRARPLMQSRSGVVISELTKRHVTSQAKHVEARTKARFDRPATKRTEVKHVEARTKARFDRSTTKPTTLLHIHGHLLLLRAQHAFSTYEPTAQSMRLLDRYYFLALMDPPPYFYAASVREFFSTLEDWRGAFGLPSSAPPEARFAPQSRPAFPRIARILAPQGTRCRSAITRLEMPQILWKKQLASAQSYLIPLPRLLSYYLLRRGHQLPESDRRVASHTYVIDQWVRVIHSGSQLTTHGTRRKRDLHVVPLSSTTESPLPSVPTFDTSLPVLPISLPPPLFGCPRAYCSYFYTSKVPVSDLPRPSQPQVTDATSSTLSIMARLDTLQELFVSMDSRIDARLKRRFFTPADTSLEGDGGTEVIGSGSNTRAPTVGHETMPILQTSGAVGQVDGEIFIRATDTGMDIIIRDDPPMVRDLARPLHLSWRLLIRLLHLCLEEIDGAVTPIIGA